MSVRAKICSSRRVFVTVFLMLILISGLNVFMFIDGPVRKDITVSRSIHNLNNDSIITTTGIYSNAFVELQNISKKLSSEYHKEIFDVYNQTDKLFGKSLHDAKGYTKKTDSMTKKWLEKLDSQQPYGMVSWRRKTYSPNAVLRPGVLGNYEPAPGTNRTGPGENNQPVVGPDNKRLPLIGEDFKYGLSATNSETISLDRVLPDIRLDECRYWHYPEKLPTASVVIVFFNECWSTLLRTVHSVINTSPPSLLTEIILVDDFSDMEHLKFKLDEYMEEYSEKVKIIRNNRREGLIRSKNFGAEVAVGDVLVFLDAHCECSPNWLPPLLTRIAYDRTIMAAPIIDKIDWSTFEYSSVYGQGHRHYRGVFEWGFFYKEKLVPQRGLEKRQHHSEPYWSPNNAGGLFAMDREYFLHLGGYDPGFLVWGGENFELAFKVWQCGGSSEWVPCSRVGHIYKHHTPDRKVNLSTKLPFQVINYIRFVEVWMEDEFKEFFYRREPQTRGFPVNIAKQLQFKGDNHCGTFRWFMENVAYDVYEQYPPPPPNVAWGRISILNGRYCLATNKKFNGMSAMGLTSCRSTRTVFRLNTAGKMGLGEQCVTAHDDEVVTINKCPLGDESGHWSWDKRTGLLLNEARGKCLTMNPPSFIHFTPCDKDNLHQQWNITEFYTWK